jgi:hypothetical protein
MVVVKLGSESYRQGKVFHFDRDTLSVKDGDGSWAKGWEQMSHAGASARQVPGWKAEKTGSVLYPREYQKLAGPWTGGIDPASGTAAS